jgi:hypothetical protein
VGSLRNISILSKTKFWICSQKRRRGAFWTSPTSSSSQAFTHYNSRLIWSLLTWPGAGFIYQSHWHASR